MSEFFFYLFRIFTDLKSRGRIASAGTSQTFPAMGSERTKPRCCSLTFWLPWVTTATKRSVEPMLPHWLPSRLQLHGPQNHTLSVGMNTIILIKSLQWKCWPVKLSSPRLRVRVASSQPCRGECALMQSSDEQDVLLLVWMTARQHDRVVGLGPSSEYFGAFASCCVKGFFLTVGGEEINLCQLCGDNRNMTKPGSRCCVWFDYRFLRAHISPSVDGLQNSVVPSQPWNRVQ